MTHESKILHQTMSSRNPLLFNHVNEKLDLESVRALVATINQHLDKLLANAKAWKSLKMKCNSNIRIEKQEFFEFSDHSVMSNLHWGIENIEAAMQAHSAEDKASKLKNSENLLQLPASLDEHEITAGIPNHYLVSYAYFYLSIVRKLEGDEWHVAVHFLQSLLVSPKLVYTELVPKLCQSLFLTCCKGNENKVSRSQRRSRSASLADSDEDEVNEVMKWVAKEYKARLMYYQIMSYEDKTKKQHRNKCSAFSDDEPESLRYQKSQRSKSSKSCNLGNQKLDHLSVHILDCHKNNVGEEVERGNQVQLCNMTDADTESNCFGKTLRRSSIRCLKDILLESDSDTLLDSDDNSSVDESFCEEYMEECGRALSNRRTDAENEQAGTSNQTQQAPWNFSYTDRKFCIPRASEDSMDSEACGVELVNIFSQRFSRKFSSKQLSDLRLRNRAYISPEGNTEQTTIGKLQHKEYQRRSLKSRSSVGKHSEENLDQAGILERVISSICHTEEMRNFQEDYAIEITTIYEILNNKTGLKYSLLKDVILDQLLKAISTSKEEKVIRASVCILATMISANRSVADDIKRKGLRLYDLATALRRNVHEAATLIYLINPSPAEIKTLELLPCLVEIVCTSRSYKLELRTSITPTAASLMIIEILVTAFDYTTNNMHLAVISSPNVLSGLLDIPRNDNIQEVVSLASVLVKCMQFDGDCRKYITEVAPISQIISLLRSNQTRASYIGLEFFHEMLRVPRSSGISILQQMKKEASIDNRSVLMLHIQESELEYKLLAANLLIQLDMLEDKADGSIYMKTAIEVILESVKCEENSTIQALAASILSNIGGTYSWTGEPCTITWLLKKAGLTSPHQRNIIRNFDFLDENQQYPATDTWSSKLAKRIIKFGLPVFHSLDKGLKSKTKRVSRDSLTAIAWLGCEIVKSSGELRYSACETILTSVEQYIHPGIELEERILACLCIYNYTYGRGMKKLFNFSEGVRESLRRLSGTIWLAEELLKVAEYLQPNKWRISCVHTQIMEAGDNSSGAVTALIYYNGYICSGYADGEIKLWDIKGQTATLIWDRKEHDKAVRCFSIYEQGNRLLSGSSDKTIKIWHMVKTNLECIEVIRTKETIRSLDTFGKDIYAITKTHKLKVFDSSRKATDVLKSKRVKSIKLSKGKVYLGCLDSSIQELAITHTRQLELKAATKKWMMTSKPINSLAVYKDWLYSASVVLEGSTIKDWKRNTKPQISLVPEQKSNILAMEVVEDFIYLNCSGSSNNLQIWLRGTQHKVGRLSGGSKITSLLCANDMVICGTATGLIKGWIPL